MYYSWPANTGHYLAASCLDLSLAPCDLMHFLPSPQAVVFHYEGMPSIPGMLVLVIGVVTYLL